MLDICLLGSGGMMPLPNRYLTALLARYNGNSVLIDCGEATQVAIKKSGWSVHPIGLICITHFHGDHIAGLPGLLLSIGNAERKEPILIVGPKGLERVVKSLLVIAPDLPYELKFLELEAEGGSFRFEGMKITAFRVKHNVICYGYTISVERAGKFDPEKATANLIPLKYWSRLQKGEVIKEEGKMYFPEMVMGAARRGLKVTYCTDTRPTEKIKEMAEGVDLFICEGMYGGTENDVKAKAKKHMTMNEAAEIGSLSKPRRMWLTHYSPSLVHPEWYLKEILKIFDRIELGKDGKSITLLFDEE